jgi:anaerobic dimethyl sulfoxide reductase subunit A
MTREEVGLPCLDNLRAIQPDLQIIADLIDNPQFSDGYSLLQQFLDELQEMDTKRLHEYLTELSGEYADLFLLGGTRGLRPYESACSGVDGLVMGEARDRVLSAYRETRMLPKHIYKHPEDYLATELEFMSRLCRYEDTVEAQKSFLSDHVLTWVPQLCEKLKQVAISPLYQGLSQLLSGYLLEEKQILELDNSATGIIENAKLDEALAALHASPVWDYFIDNLNLLRENVQLSDLDAGEEKRVFSGCSHDCGARCPLEIQVKDGRIIKIMPHPLASVELRPCIRGLLYHYRSYSPDRLKFPLKRVGERGEGKFARISWDEALDTVTNEIMRIGDTYGPGAIMGFGAGGSTGRFQNRMALQRLLNMAGGHSDKWGNASAEGAVFASIATFGTDMTGNERDDLLNANMIILWGCNPAESLFANPTRWYLLKAKEQGIPIVCIDPRFTETIASVGSKWIPILPGTDTAMLVAMAYVIISEDLHDQQFLDRHVIGFDRYRDYVTGIEDGIPKTPEWAENITGVPAQTIKELALQYTQSRPSALIAGFAPGRTASGEQFHRAAIALSVMTGNIGIHGGGAGGIDVGWRDHKGMYDMPDVPNPVDEAAPPRRLAFKRYQSAVNSAVHITHMWDAILKGKSAGYEHDYKMLYIVCSNAVNQYPGTNSAVKAMQKPEFIVVHEQFMTPTAKFADILLPTATWVERSDITLPGLVGTYAIYANQAIETMYDTKTELQICTELAERLGITGFNDKTEDEWLRYVAQKHDIPDYETFKKKGLYEVKLQEPHIAFKDQISDPDHHKFPTPSGKIELYCKELDDLDRPDILPAIPKYVEMWEGVHDPSKVKYPLQLITTHSRKRVHSILDNINWHRNIEPHTVWMNPVDAGVRSISDGDDVRVYNDRGTMIIPAKVTRRIIHGVVCIYQGAWFNPDDSGIDRGGCANVLTRAEHSPGGAHCSNTALVQIDKVLEISE